MGIITPWSLAFIALIFNTYLQVLFWRWYICLPTQSATKLFRVISSQRIPSPAEVPGNRSPPRCPLCLVPPELHKKQLFSSHQSLSLATSKLLQAGKTSFTSHSLKAAGRLFFFFFPTPPPLPFFQVGSEGGFSPFPSIPEKEGGWVSFFGRKGSEQV